MKNIDPQVTVDEALDWAGQNQAELARQLGIGRAAVNEWITTGRKNLPPLQAYRFMQLRYRANANA